MKKMNLWKIKNEKIENVIGIVSTTLALIIGAIIAFFQATYALIFIITYFASLFCFLKRNFVITKLLYFEVSRPKLVTMLDYVISYSIYGIILYLALTINTWCFIISAMGLFVIKIITLIIGMATKNDNK